MDVSLQAVRTKKYGDHWWVSPLTGKRRRLTKVETGLLPTQEEARAWVAEHLPSPVVGDLKSLVTGPISLNVSMVKTLEFFRGRGCIFRKFKDS